MLWTTGERPDGEPFEEQPTRIGMQLWRDLPRPGDVESAVRSDLPRGLIGRHQDSLSRYQSMVARTPSAKSVCFGAQPNSLLNRKWSMAYRRSWPPRSTTGRNRRDRGPSTPAGSAAPRGCHVRPRRRSRLTLGLHRYSVGAVRHSRRMVAGPALIGIAELLVSPGNRSTIP
jgi:hypothetical protein